MIRHMPHIVGREAEWSVIEAFLGRSTEGPRALVVEGAAGIGKSTLWLAAVAAARNHGYVVLSSRPAEGERLLANVVLGDLLRDVRPEELATLPTPRRRAFESALLMRDDPGAEVDARALGVAVVTLLSLLARDAPLLVAIDDDQWMDPSSAATISFALRRLAGQRLSLLVARRALEVGAGTLEHAVRPAAIERLTVGPLSVGALQAVVRDRLGLVLTRPTQVRLHEVSGGNAFYALEVARTLSPHGSSRSGDLTITPGVPARLDRLIDARLQALDGASQEALLLIASHGRLPTAALGASTISASAVEAAHRAGVLETVDDMVRYTHPLLASAIYHGASDEQRRAAHQRLAGIVDDPLHRARHLALGADGPDQELAASLDVAARLASERGVSIAAAELSEHALRLTPPDATEEAHRRAGAAARANSAAGDGIRARAIAADMLAAAMPGRQRAEALLLAADFEAPGAARAILEQALVEAAGASEIEARIHAALSEIRYFAAIEGNAWAERHAKAALELAERLDDDALRANAFAILAVVHLSGGEPDALELAERAYRIAAGTNDSRLLRQASECIGHVLTWLGDTDRARAWLEARLAEWRERDERAHAEFLWYLAVVETLAGRWAVAQEYVDRSAEVTAAYGLESPWDFYPAALLALHRGDLQAARTLSGRGLALGGDESLLHSYFGILGACDLWSEDPQIALASFARADASAEALGIREPADREWCPEHVEALLQVGRIDEADALTSALDVSSRRLERQRVVAQAVRCRGLIASARGDAETAVDLLEEAVAQHERAGDPYGRARAQLALGVNLRRTRQKRSARDAIGAALATFEALGAQHWAAAARVELGRIGGRQRISGLSASELRVASLVAEGRTNWEIASTLFLGERTVASHLTHIYAKLGIRSRTELAMHLVTAAEAVPAAHSPHGSVSKVPTS